MKPTLKPGLTHRFTYQVPQSRTVPHLGEGRHQRFVVAWDKFKAQVAQKLPAGSS